MKEMNPSKTSFVEAERYKWPIRGVLACLGCGFSYLIRGNVYSQAALAATLGYLLTGRRYEWLYILRKTAYRDLLGFRGVTRIMWRIWTWERQNATVASVFSETAARSGDKPAFVMGDVTFTFRQGEELSNRVAWYFKRQGFKRGEAIALVMETKPEFIFIWLGLAKIGVVTALINSNLRADSLVYCVKISNCKAVIFGDEIIDAIKDIQRNPDLKDIPFFQYNTSDAPPTLENASLLSSEMAEMPTASLLEDIRAGKSSDKVLYIYTSGTTGFPKAAIVTNIRYLMIATGIHCVVGLTSSDVVYDPLPLYHTAGGALGAGQALVVGATVVLRKKFSASNYWSDCAKYKCTVAQYIGEICRYLLSTSPGPSDRAHRVRLIIGNGLRAQIWRQFVDRFGVARVVEFYGATEGNCNIINLDSTVGAIGFMPRILKPIYPLTLLKCDQMTGEIFRDARGRCVECAPNEPGLLVGKIDQNRAILKFSGYADKTASEKKLVRNVLAEGDCFFNTGDILVMDHLGYFYFKDRTGDTFRWKGENVSATEVESVISTIVGLTDTVVFGVTVPNTEGRAGMAAIVDPERKIDLKALAAGLRNGLPPYARPLFLRVTAAAPVTSTFKLKKRELMADGYDVGRSDDEYYFADPRSGEFVPLTRTLYDDIASGKVRV